MVLIHGLISTEKTVLMIMGLVPSVIATQNDIPINDAIQLYSEDLPNADSAEEEFLRWKHRWGCHTRKRKTTNGCLCFEEV